MTVAIPAAKTVFWLSKNPITTPPAAPIVPTAISKASPAVLTFTATTPLAAFDLVYMAGTGFPELDGKFFIANPVSATSVTLMGSNTLGSAGILVPATAKLHTYKKTTDLVQVCVSSFTRQGGSSEPVSVGTFCDPTATIPGTTTAGSATLNGFMDPTEYGYVELVEASNDETVRVLEIKLPDNKGSIIVVGSFSGMSEDYTLGQGISFSVDMGLSTKPTYSFPALP